MRALSPLAGSPPPLSPPPQPGSPQQPGNPAGAIPASSDGSPDGATERGSWQEMSVLRSGGGTGALGIDVNEFNCVCRISPGSAAAISGELQVGDVIHAIDGKNLAGFTLGNLIGDVARPSYRFRVWRPPYDAESAERLGDGIMDTLKLQQVVQGKSTSDSPYKYSSQQGRQVSDSDARARIALARRKSSPLKVPR